MIKMSEFEAFAPPIQIKTNNSETESVLDSPKNEKNLIQNVCTFCVLLEAKYTCPRCNIMYCSVTCYQSEKHASCSEAFYKECVLDELKETSTSNEDREKVLEMLAKDMEEREADDDIIELDGDDTTEVEDLSERLKGLDLDNDISMVWSRLTSKEKEEFARMLQDGRLAHLIEIWKPWWTVTVNMKLVVEAKAKQGEGETSIEIPEIYSDIPDNANILKNGMPSVNCRFDVLNILIAYAFMTRLHNGGHTECAVDSTQDLIDVCLVLKDSNNCSSVGEAVQTALEDITKKSKDDAKNVQFITFLEDVKKLILGPGKNNSITFMSAALSDVLRLLRKSFSILKKELRYIERGSGTCKNVFHFKTMKSVVFKAEKKVVFLLSWLQRYGMTVHQLQPLLQFEIETRESEIAEVSDLKIVVEENMDKLKPIDKISKSSIADNNSVQLGAAKIVELD